MTAMLICLRPGNAIGDDRERDDPPADASLNVHRWKDEYDRSEYDGLPAEVELVTLPPPLAKPVWMDKQRS